MIRRVVSIAVVAALLILLMPVKITFTSEAAMVDDPFNVAIAPHFSKVVYTLTEPSYSTSCDVRGDFKALVGTPSIAIFDSRLVLTPTTSMKSSIVLSRTDVPLINQTRAYYEMSFNVSNTLSWTNISLYDLPNDWVNISVHSGAFYYDYDSGSRQLGVFYSPTLSGHDYTVAFDLTISSVTLFLYGSNGTLLANKYISNNRLVGGDLDEIRFELQGSTSNVLKLDYLYVLGSASPGANFVSLSLDPLNPDDLSEEKRIDLDPTAISLDQSLRRELFGFEDVTFDSKVSQGDLLNAIGQTDIHQQRAAGRLVAEGYKNVKGSVESSLTAYIATAESVDEDEVHLIDYYIDYVQCKVEVHKDVLDKLVETYNNSAPWLVEELGGTLEAETASVSMLTIPARVSGWNITWTDVAWVVAPIPMLIAEGLRGLKDWSEDTLEDLRDPLGLEDRYDELQDTLDDIYQDTLNRADLTYNQTVSLFRDWQRSTDENYKQVRQDFLNFISISNAQTAQLVSSYEEMQDRFERTISKFYSMTENQFEVTNAIIARLLLQNQEFAEATRETSTYFAGQLAKTNEVILNITSAITQALTPQDFWKDVYDGGKLQSEPLTFASFFGNNMRTWTLIFVGIFVTIVIAIVLVTVLKPGRRTRTKKR